MPGDINLSSDDKVPRKVLGVRYEPSISMGSLLILVGFALQAAFFWVGVEHRLTANEINFTNMKERTDGWHAEGVVARAGIVADISGIRQTLGQMSERVDVLTSRK